MRGDQAWSWGTTIRLALAGCLLTLAAAAPAAAMPTPKGPQIVDGPTADLVSPVGLQSAIARDGSGGLVYLKNAGGVPHVFFVSFVGGVFASPAQLDAGQVGASSSPVIAAGASGALAVAWINSGSLWVVTRTAAGQALTVARRLVGSAASPDIAMSTLGKTYLAFTVPDGAGTDVRAAYWAGGNWTIENAPLNQTPGDDAGTGDGRSAVTAAQDGVGIVAWGEGGHVWARRVWAAAPSVVDTQLDSPLPGCSESSADEPAIGSGGDSSYASVAFREELTCGGQSGYRVLAARLRVHQSEYLHAADGLGGGVPQNAGNPVEAIGEYGRGWVVAAQADGGVGAQSISGNGAPSGSSFTANGEPNATPSYPTAGIAGTASTLIAWQHDDGTVAGPEIRLRYAESANTLGPETVLSSPGQGPTDAADGLAASGNGAGETAVVWVQGAPGSRAIVANLLYRPPGPPTPVAMPTKYLRTTQPTFTWLPSSELWGPVIYGLAIDGAAAAQTTGTAFQPPAPLGQGPHTWSVNATNPAGETSAARSQRIFIDSLAPQVAITLGGRRVARALEHLVLHETDVPPGTSPADASGIAKTTVTWGDRTPATTTRRYHVYLKPGRYRIRVTVTDAAGNVTRTSLVVRIKKPPKAKPKHKTTGKK